jgi:hypothetical protein
MIKKRKMILLEQRTWMREYSLAIHLAHLMLRSNISVWNKISASHDSLKSRSLHRKDLVDFEAELQAKREAAAAEDDGQDDAETDYAAIMRELGNEAMAAEAAEAEYAEAMKQMWEGGLGDYGGPDAGFANIGDGGVVFDGNGVPALEQYKFGTYYGY